MSKIYCEITESARRTVPTARAHDAATVRVKNWVYAVECRMIDGGGGERDEICVTLRCLATGETITLANGIIREVRESMLAAP